MKTEYKNRHKFVTIQNTDIFNSVKERINAKNNGATVFVPHVCNNVDLFNTSFAQKIENFYPIVASNYHMIGKTSSKNYLGYSQIIEAKKDSTYGHKLFFINMIAQNGLKNHLNPRPLNYMYLSNCMYEAIRYIKKNTGILNKTEKVEIHAPRFGTGISGGNWSFISDLIDDIWGSVPTYIYENDKKL